MPTDADTTHHADDLWRLVHLVQETIDKDGSPMLFSLEDGGPRGPLADLRRLADAIDPENGRY